MNFKSINNFFKQNGPGLCTLGSMILTGLSVYFAIKKAPEGAAEIEKHEENLANLEFEALADRRPDDELTLKVYHATRMARIYKESLLCASGAMGLAYAANKMNAKTIAGLGAALAISEDKLKKVYQHADKVFGKGGKDDLKEMTDCDIPPFDPDEPVERAKHSRKKDVIEIFFDSYTGTKFESTGKNVENAISRASYRITNEKNLNFNKWFSILGLPDVRAGLCVGWNKRKCPFKVYTKLVYIDGEAVTGIFYENDPISDYLN